MELGARVAVIVRGRERVRDRMRTRIRWTAGSIRGMVEGESRLGPGGRIRKGAGAGSGSGRGGRSQRSRAWVTVGIMDLEKMRVGHI